MKMVKTLKNEVLIRSSRKLEFERRIYIHSIEQPLITLNLKYFVIQMKLRYLKSFLQSRLSLLPSYCMYHTDGVHTHILLSLVTNKSGVEDAKNMDD